MVLLLLWCHSYYGPTPAMVITLNPKMAMVLIVPYPTLQVSSRHTLRKEPKDRYQCFLYEDISTKMRMAQVEAGP